MVLFDFDGVLADSLEVCLAACRIAAKYQGSDPDYGLDAFADLDPLTFEAFAEREGLDPKAFVDAVAGAVQANPIPSLPFPGVTDTIAEIAQAHTLAVVSASHGDVVSAFLSAHGMADCFKHIAGGDTPGDKATKIRALIAETSGDRHLFVGDAVSDIAAARKAGIPCCAVAWGWQPLDRLLVEQPDHVARMPHDIAVIAKDYVCASSGD